MKKKLEVGMKVRHKNGLTGRVICTDRKSEHCLPVVILLSFRVGKNGEEHEDVRFCNPYGFLNGEAEFKPISEWDDFEIDEPVMVSLGDSEMWYRRYFAGVTDDGYPLTFEDGRTSWTTDSSERIEWKRCRRPTEEELKK